jgi:hypothetical protein
MYIIGIKHPLNFLQLFLYLDIDIYQPEALVN